MSNVDQFQYLIIKFIFHFFFYFSPYLQLHRIYVYLCQGEWVYIIYTYCWIYKWIWRQFNTSLQINYCYEVINLHLDITLSSSLIERIGFTYFN